MSIGTSTSAWENSLPIRPGTPAARRFTGMYIRSAMTGWPCCW